MEDQKKMLIILSVALLSPLALIPGFELVRREYYIGLLFFMLPLVNLPLGIYGLTREDKTKAIKVLSIINIILSAMSIILYITFLVFLIEIILLFIRGMVDFIRFFQAFPG